MAADPVPDFADQLAKARATALACADAAGPIARRYFRQSVAADAKGDESPVTIADREAEIAMRAILAASFPEHAILGEEFGTQGRADSEWQWVLDPIDGTRAFITGRPSFGTLIALLHKGRPVLGVLDQPITRERWVGISGQPTIFTSELGGTIGTRAAQALEDSELSCTSPAIFDATGRARFDALAGAAKRVSWGGDCYAYGLLALGQIDLVAEASMKIWDWAALVPIVEGAGGVMTDWAGAPLTAASDGTVLASGNAALHAQSVAQLAKNARIG